MADAIVSLCLKILCKPNSIQWARLCDAFSVEAKWFASDVGMHAWLAAAVDTQYAVVVPIIGVQVCQIKCCWLLSLNVSKHS